MLILFKLLSYLMLCALILYALIKVEVKSQGSVKKIILLILLLLSFQKLLGQTTIVKQDIVKFTLKVINFIL